VRYGGKEDVRRRRRPESASPSLKDGLQKGYRCTMEMMKTSAGRYQLKVVASVMLWLILMPYSCMRLEQTFGKPTGPILGLILTGVTAVAGIIYFVKKGTAIEKTHKRPTIKEFINDRVNFILHAKREDWKK
jgi:hypothetical protein